jgi:hypothetical protein
LAIPANIEEALNTSNQGGHPRDTTDDQDDERFDNDIESQREAIRGSLDEIAIDIGMVMRDEGLHFPVCITVRVTETRLRRSRRTVDPSNDDWSRASAIVYQIIEKKIGGGRLRSRELACAVANAAPINAAEVTAK